MAEESKWKRAARRIIGETLREARRQGLDAQATIKAVEQAYPWGERRNHAYQCWLAVRKQMLGDLLPRGRGRPETGEPLDRDYFARLDGPGSLTWEAMLCRKRRELMEEGIPADLWDDERVAAWRPGREEPTDA